ncbi:MAG: PIN domain-containing protein [Nanoarchaeota archaeon]
MDYILDTHAWIEYFRGSEAGEQVKRAIENTNNRVYTAECSMGELWEWATREKHDFERASNIMMAITSFCPIELADWTEAARIKREIREKHRDFGMMDALILCKQRQLGCRLLTGDPHFAGLPGVTIYDMKR